MQYTFNEQRERGKTERRSLIDPFNQLDTEQLVAQSAAACQFCLDTWRCGSSLGKACQLLIMHASFA